MRKISTITPADGDNYDIIIEAVKNQLKEKKRLQIKCQPFQIYCCANLFRQMVETAFGEIEDVIDKVSTHFPYWHKTLSNLHIIKGEYRSYRLPKKKEWKKLRYVCRLVAYIYNAAEVFFFTDNPTTSLYLHNLRELQASLRKESTSPNRLSVATNLLKMFTGMTCTCYSGGNIQGIYDDYKRHILEPCTSMSHPVLKPSGSNPCDPKTSGLQPFDSKPSDSNSDNKLLGHTLDLGDDLPRHTLERLQKCDSELFSIISVNMALTTPLRNHVSWICALKNKISTITPGDRENYGDEIEAIHVCEPSGDILLFLTGEQEIEDVYVEKFLKTADLHWITIRTLVDDVLQKVKGLEPIAKELSVSLAQLAIAWCAANLNVSSVITGATKIQQASELVEAAFAKIGDVFNKIWTKTFPYWNIRFSEAIKAGTEGDFSEKLGRVFFFTNLRTDDEWVKLKYICRLVEYMYDSAEVLFMTKNPTASLYLHNLRELHARLRKESMSPDRLSISTYLLMKFEKYWNDMFLVLAIATVMDPRCKMKYIEFSSMKYGDKSGNSQVTTVVEAIQGIFDDYKIHTLEAQHSLKPSGSMPSASVSSNFDSEELSSNFLGIHLRASIIATLDLIVWMSIMSFSNQASKPLCLI
ncbi:hypothetical protein POM88_023263 [Heracleum sosnowskyi]|uniref:hAT-like transposase RNase-H fold domain-containing protein n=1 Tax=Heracleum sosnowskyi TaxID=360622 RepID=A0AAD8IJ50_9APIA|nr:hypothetical protein POM88_023263 [Heracleum sosnowskyi]